MSEGFGGELASHQAQDRRLLNSDFTSSVGRHHLIVLSRGMAWSKFAPGRRVDYGTARVDVGTEQRM
jgi:hypothetical protein